jgi:hypothetical protein
MVFAQSMANTNQLVREVAGVTEVDNRIVVVRSPAGSV